MSLEGAVPPWRQATDRGPMEEATCKDWTKSLDAEIIPSQELARNQGLSPIATRIRLLTAGGLWAPDENPEAAETLSREPSHTTHAQAADLQSGEIKGDCFRLPSLCDLLRTGENE